MKTVAFPKTMEVPKVGVPLLGPGKPSKLNACLNFSHDMTHGYVEGYRKGAESLITWAEAHYRDQDYLIYPILFLYRHHLELRLKDILGSAHRVGMRKSPSPKGHDILQQWSEAKAVLAKIAGSGDKKWFDSVSDCIAQIAAVDPASDAFRYPTRKDGSASIPGITQIHLTNLRVTMTEILDWLDAASGVLHDFESEG